MRGGGGGGGGNLSRLFDGLGDAGGACHQGEIGTSCLLGHESSLGSTDSMILPATKVVKNVLPTFLPLDGGAIMASRSVILLLQGDISSIKTLMYTTYLLSLPSSPY